jgi:ribonuclease BN (tRNA processing enzyme)
VRLTVIGCSGSFAGPDSPASCYLLQADDAAGRVWSVALDLGSGAFGPLQRFLPPEALDAICLSHLHPDHSADLSGLHVYAKYHPVGPLPPIAVHAPAGAAAAIARHRGEEPGAGVGDGVFDFRAWADGEPVAIGPLKVTPFAVEHPLETYGFRVTGPSSLGGGSATLAYTGDADESPGLDALAAGADLLLAEAAFEEGRDVVRGIHLTGRRAGALARRAGAHRLVLTHLPPWNSRARALADAAGEYDGPLGVARANAVFAV